MGFFSKKTRHVLMGFGVGAGVAFAAPYVLPVLGSVVRPLTKAVFKQALLAVERSREGAARVLEDMEDLIAEVRDEIEIDLAGEVGRPAPEQEEEAGNGVTRERA